MVKYFVWAAVTLVLIGFALRPAVVEPLQILWYWNDHRPYDSFDGPVEYLGVIPADSYGDSVSGLAYRGWKGENGLHHYRFVNTGNELIYVHSEFIQRYLGLRHVVLGPGDGAEFRVHTSGVTEVANVFTIYVDKECSWRAAYGLIPTAAVDAYFVVPAGNFE